jgi:SAM-dependent methyltransferase
MTKPIQSTTASAGRSSPSGVSSAQAVGQHGQVREFNLVDEACCPRCHSGLLASSQRVFCANPNCQFSKDGFPVVDGRPALIDFDNSLFEREDFVVRHGESVLPRNQGRRALRERLRTVLAGRNHVAMRNAERFAGLLKTLHRDPRIARVLVIGGGTIGDGIAQLSARPDISVIGTDVYLSEATELAADGHSLPFRNESFDGVWIQAVLEHVLEPAQVVSEIERVLKREGVVYAEIPFMQQVHEGAYDFTRFTASGLRWLFRRFKLEGMGPVGGPGTALAWSLQYFVRAVTGSDQLARLSRALFFWLRFFDSIGNVRLRTDAASGLFFLGVKSETPALDLKEIVPFYDALQNKLRARPEPLPASLSPRTLARNRSGSNAMNVNAMNAAFPEPSKKH